MLVNSTNTIILPKFYIFLNLPAKKIGIKEIYD